MTQIGIFYGSSTGNTESATIAIDEALRALPGVEVDIFEISRKHAPKLADYGKLILGIPTWDIGQMQNDWELVVPTLKTLDLTGKQVALYGCGDQLCYPDSYQDAIGLLAEIVVERGATIVGHWSVDGYDFEDSLAVADGMFLGLALDDNQPELTPGRIQAWVQQLSAEFALVAVETLP